MIAPHANSTTAAPVLENTTTNTYGEGANGPLDLGHSQSMDTTNGTLSMSFSLDGLFGDFALVSKDGRDNSDGDFTVWVRNGVLTVSFQDGTDTEWLSIPQVLDADTTYQFAMSFGDDGLQLWLNGELVAAEPEFTTGLDANTQSLVVGGTRAWRDDQTDPAHSLFEGEIGHVRLYDQALDGADMILLAGDVDPALGMQAAHHAGMADLMPLFEQLHHGSDTLTEILADYGVSGHGHVMRELTHETGTDASEKLSGNVDDDAMFGGAGDDTLSGRSGEDLLQGGTGNDRLFGGAGDDIIDGGEGEDFLRGGAGNDLLISRGDGREPDIAYDPDRDEGDPLNELTNGKLYPNQPVPGGDALVGDKGADIFYFQSLINAKERFIKKHTQDDGTINWHGVAGENDSLHDHWVDSIGHDMIMDYSRAEGDRIVIEGHTTQISDITYGDADGDGVLDHSIISLYSDQGNNGGAHNLDELGTITVYGDLVKLSDIEHTAAPAYGIVATIEDIKNALAPSEVSEDIEHKFVSALTDGGTVTADDGTPPVFAASGSYSFVRDERAALVFDHTNAMSLASGTIALTFQADVLIDHQWLISKDATGNADGHLAVYLNVDGNLTVRLQTADKSHYFTIEEAIETGRSYDFAVTFGDQGLEVYLDGVRAAYDEELQVGLDGNNEALIIGANGWSATPGTTDNINSHFTGEISDVAVYDRQLDADELYGSAPRSNIQYMTGEVESYTVAQNAAGDIILKGEEGRTVVDDAEYIAFDDLSVRTQDIEFGSKNEDTITGSDGADILVGRGGADQLFGYGNDDVLMGRWGDDSLWGSEGNDLLLGDIGDDYLNGGSQSDTLHGGEGDDDLKGGEGDDHLYGGLGDDYLYGESWGEADPSATDIVYYDGNLADYSFTTNTWFHTSRGETVQQLIVEDTASGGLDGFYEGQDRLLDIDLIVFADQTVSFVDLL